MYSKSSSILDWIRFPRPLIGCRRSADQWEQVAIEKIPDAGSGRTQIHRQAAADVLAAARLTAAAGPGLAVGRRQRQHRTGRLLHRFRLDAPPRRFAVLLHDRSRSRRRKRPQKQNKKTKKKRANKTPTGYFELRSLFTDGLVLR